MLSYLFCAVAKGKCSKPNNSKDFVVVVVVVVIVVGVAYCAKWSKPIIQMIVVDDVVVAI